MAYRVLCLLMPLDKKPKRARRKRGRCHPYNLTYLDAHDDAERRMKAGQRQAQCGCCGLWRWPDEKPQPNPPGKTMAQILRERHGV